MRELPGTVESSSGSYGVDAQIATVTFRNSRGAVNPVFRTGEDVEIGVRYRCIRPVQDAVFAVAVHGQRGEQLIFSSTHLGGVPLPLLTGEGTLSCRLHEIPLRGGSYRVSVGLLRGPEGAPYDSHYQRYRFDVASDGTTIDAVLEVPCDWTHTLTADAVSAMDDDARG